MVSVLVSVAPPSQIEHFTVVVVTVPPETHTHAPPSFIAEVTVVLTLV